MMLGYVSSPATVEGSLESIFNLALEIFQMAHQSHLKVKFTRCPEKFQWFVCGWEQAGKEILVQVGEVKSYEAYVLWLRHKILANHQKAKKSYHVVKGSV